MGMKLLDFLNRWGLDNKRGVDATRTREMSGLRSGPISGAMAGAMQELLRSNGKSWIFRRDEGLTSVLPRNLSTVDFSNFY
jgi:hypothetical protein